MFRPPTPVSSPDSLVSHQVYAATQGSCQRWVALFRLDDPGVGKLNRLSGLVMPYGRDIRLCEH